MWTAALRRSDSEKTFLIDQIFTQILHVWCLKVFIIYDHAWSEMKSITPISVNIDRCFQLTAHIQFHKSLDNKTVYNFASEHNHGRFDFNQAPWCECSADFQFNSNDLTKVKLTVKELQPFLYIRSHFQEADR